MKHAFDVNTDEAVKLANKLEKVHKSALPVAVRATLNDAAFEAKQKHVEKTFASKFTTRKKSFIRSHTSVNKVSNTFNINQMQSEMGVIKGKSNAGDELNKQEFGGTVKNRDFIPMNPSRVSKSQSKLVSKRFYLKNIKSKNKGRKPIFKDQGFIKAAFKAGKNGFVLFENVLLHIRTIKKQGNSNLFIKADPLYSYEKGRSVSLQKAPFIGPAGLKASSNMGVFFKKNAEKQIKKYLK